MKKTLPLFLIALFLFLSSNVSLAIDKENLRRMFNYPSSNDFPTREAAARQNIGLLEEIVFISDMQGDNWCAREGILMVLRHYAEVGAIYTKEKYFDILLRLYNQAAAVAHPKRLENTKNMIKGQLSSFGLVSSTKPLSFSFSAFPSLANSMSTAGFIKNQGILNSLNQKISNAKDILDKKGADAKTTAINKVQAAINELDAQRGKHITEDGYQILSGYCKNLITKIQSTN
ncbi:MAG: hypothetical protein AAB276_02155 [Pseudomonadota bacterium]